MLYHNFMQYAYTGYKSIGHFPSTYISIMKVYYIINFWCKVKIIMKMLIAIVHVFADYLWL